MQVPMNLLNDKETAAFTDTGVWSSKAIKEAKLFGNVDMVCSVKRKKLHFYTQRFCRAE